MGLERKAASNSLEVEDLLKVACEGSLPDVPVLREIEVKHGWRAAGKNTVPLARWNDTVCEYLEHGYAGLVDLAKKGGASRPMRDFCLALLDTLKTSESVEAAVEICAPAMKHPAREPELARRAASTFNLLLSFPKAPAIPDELERRIRDFLHALLSLVETESDRATVICALRGVGNEESIRLMDAQPPLAEPWTSALPIALKVVRKRLKVAGRRKP